MIFMFIIWGVICCSVGFWTGWIIVSHHSYERGYDDALWWHRHCR